MKKYVLAMLLVISILGSCFGLTGCDFIDQIFGGSQGNQTQSNSNVPSVETQNKPNNTQTETPQINISTEPITVTVREETAMITDSGRASQKMDVVFLSNYFNVQEAYRGGYTKLYVTFSFEVAEINDGYQYVFFYSDTKCKGNSFFDKVVDEFYNPQDPSLLYEYRLEHGGTGKYTDWGSHTFSATIKMSRLKDELYIRYGASGQDDDDWKNRNIVVTFQVSK